MAATFNPVRLLVDRYFEADTDLLFNATIYQMLNLTCQYSLVDYSDICGMASSLEIRSPFLDARMLELAAAIPPSWKVGGDNQDCGKMILREAMAERLPDSVRFADKLGFGGTVPHGEWLRRQWNHLFDRDAVAATGMFDCDKIEQLLRHDLGQQPDVEHMLFNLTPNML